MLSLGKQVVKGGGVADTEEAEVAIEKALGRKCQVEKVSTQGWHEACCGW